MNPLLPWVVILSVCTIALAVALYKSQVKASILQQELDARDFRRQARAIHSTGGDAPRQFQRGLDPRPDPGELELIREHEDRKHIRRVMARRGEVPSFDKVPS